MLRGGQDHVLEASEHVRPDDVALVAAGERCDDDLRAGRDAEVVGPERDEPLDERPLAGDPCGECGMHLRLAHLDDPPPRLTALLVVALAGHSYAAKRLTDRGRVHSGRGGERRRAAVELGPQPSSSIADCLPFAATGAEPESIERA